MIPHVLALKDVSFRHNREGEFLLRAIDLAVAQGQIAAIVGRSGRGKSTLLRIAAGLQSPTKGSVVFDGKPLSTPTRKIGFVFQNFDKIVFDWLTVRENINLAHVPHFSKKINIDETEQLARRLGIADLLERPAKKLSHGQRQRVAIARSLSHGAKLILLDEPFASLDSVARQDLIQLLRDVVKEFGCTILLVSHDIEETVQVATSLFCLLRINNKPQLDPISEREKHLRDSSREASIVATILSKLRQDEDLE
jgi:ABC-type nitrate/sulfonate/bicarbonate transport system ATPase subunit